MSRPPEGKVVVMGNVVIGDDAPFDGPAALADAEAADLWTVGASETYVVTWAEAVRLATTEHPRSRLWHDRVATTLRQAARVRALVAEAARRAEAERDDARSTLDAWFDRRALVGAAVNGGIKDAVAGYLRVSRIGGMPTELSDAARDVIGDVVDSGALADVIARAVALPHGTPRTVPLPPEGPEPHVALHVLREQCEAANAVLDPADARAVATEAMRAEAVALLRSAGGLSTTGDVDPKARALAKAVAVARTAPEGPHGSLAVMEGLAKAARVVSGPDGAVRPRT